MDVFVVEVARDLLDLSALRPEGIDGLKGEVDVESPGGLHPELKDRILPEQVRVL